MCLYFSKRMPIDGDITCYKVLLTYKRENWFGSPFVSNMWKLGETKQIKDSYFLPYDLYHDVRLRTSQKIDVGAYHTFKNKEDAIALLDRIRNMIIVGRIKDPSRYVLAKCTIPKDSKYVFRGKCNITYNNQVDGYASEKLRVDEIIDVNLGQL